MIYLKDQNGGEVMLQESESGDIVARLEFGEDEIDLDALLTVSLTLYDQATGQIINGRNDQDILNTNGTVIDDTGLVTIRLTPSDNVIVNNIRAGAIETHVARIVWTWAYEGTERQGVVELGFNVQKLTEVVSA